MPDCTHANEKREEREEQEAVFVCMDCGRERPVSSVHESVEELHRQGLAGDGGHEQ